MTQPGILSQVAPPSDSDLGTRLRNIERRLDEFASTLAGATVGADGKLTIDGILDVAGRVDVGGSLDVSGDASFAGNTTIGGDAAITGTLSLPAGIIDNAALANPVTADSFNGYDDTVTLPIDTVDLHEMYHGLITVPAGFTRAHVLLVAAVGGTNGNVNEQPIYCAAAINTHYPNVVAQGAGPGEPASVTSSYSVDLTGLSGGDQIRVSAYGAVDVSGWTGGNAHVAAQAIFLR